MPIDSLISTLQHAKRCRKWKLSLLSFWYFHSIHSNLLFTHCRNCCQYYNVYSIISWKLIASGSLYARTLKLLATNGYNVCRILFHCLSVYFYFKMDHKTSALYVLIINFGSTLCFWCIRFHVLIYSQFVSEFITVGLWIRYWNLVLCWSLLNLHLLLLEKYIPRSINYGSSFRLCEP